MSGKIARDWGKIGDASQAEWSSEIYDLNEVEVPRQMSVEIPDKVRLMFTTEQDTKAQKGQSSYSSTLYVHRRQVGVSGPHHTPVALSLGMRLTIHCKVGWVGHGVGQDM